MRVNIIVDSATPAEVYELTLAFQRTVKAEDLPHQLTTEPTVRVMGVAMTWASPALAPEQVAGFWQEYATTRAVRQETPLALGLPVSVLAGPAGIHTTTHTYSLDPSAA